VTTTQYAYDGQGNRIKKTVGATISKYLLDIQPGLSVVLSETTGANVTRYVHGPRGIQGVKDASNAWHWPTQDGLGSVRGVVDNSVGVQESRLYGPYGEPFGSTGTSQTSYGFTGEPTDANGLLYLRARYYNPTIGTFMSLDPFEGMQDRPMSLNGYSWVEGNVPNMVDPSGLQAEATICFLCPECCVAGALVLGVAAILFLAHTLSNAQAIATDATTLDTFPCTTGGSDSLGGYAPFGVSTNGLGPSNPEEDIRCHLRFFNGVDWDTRYGELRQQPYQVDFKNYLPPFGNAPLAGAFDYSIGVGGTIYVPQPTPLTESGLINQWCRL
jgi:RHS repeat-associated protein